MNVSESGSVGGKGIKLSISLNFHPYNFKLTSGKQCHFGVISVMWFNVCLENVFRKSLSEMYSTHHYHLYAITSQIQRNFPLLSISLSLASLHPSLHCLPGVLSGSVEMLLATRDSILHRTKSVTSSSLSKVARMLIILRSSHTQLSSMSSFFRDTATTGKGRRSFIWTSNCFGEVLKDTRD